MFLFMYRVPMAIIYHDETAKNTLFLWGWEKQIILQVLLYPQKNYLNEKFYNPQTSKIIHYSLAVRIFLSVTIIGSNKTYNFL